ncbi:MAG: tRNA-dihydrouridine synthase B [Chlamydiae bacterium]|nr:tRNA-dihydrouridine synthase B [Chlamydiota bacterium]
MVPITIGKKKFKSNVFYAPLAGCSDFPYREMAREYAPPGLVFCEMVKMEALARSDKNSFRLLDYTPNMHPIAAQLCGSSLKLVGRCAKILEDLGFDLIDLNCGCPVDKVTKDGSGSGLLKEPNKVGDLIAEMVAAVNIPVTVKIRVGWDHDTIVAPLITEIAEKAGAGAIFIHGRTRVQAYKGDANWDYIKECKNLAKSIKVFGNGDVFSAQSALDLLSHTGADGVLVSRGTFGQPWIAEDIYRLQGGLEPLDRGDEFCRLALIKHFNIIRRYAPEKKAILDMRRVGCWYFKRGELAKEFRQKISRVKSLGEVEAILASLGSPVS